MAISVERFHEINEYAAEPEREDRTDPDLRSEARKIAGRVSLAQERMLRTMPRLGTARVCSESTRTARGLARLGLMFPTRGRGMWKLTELGQQVTNILAGIEA